MSWIESLLDVKDVSMRCAARAKWMLTIQRPSDSPKRGPTAISPTCTGSAPVCPPGQAHPGQSDRLLSAGSGRPALLPGPHHGGVVVGHPLFELRRRRHVPVRDPRRPGVILHSDRGSHTAHDLAAAAGAHGLRRSMGATGICWDNAGAESLWSTFKHE